MAPVMCLRFSADSDRIPIPAARWV